MQGRQEDRVALRSLRNDRLRQSILLRIERLSPEAERRWGIMDPALLLPHLARGLRRALGEIPTTPPPGRLRPALLRFFFVHHLPWPEGKLKAPPGAFDLAPGNWESHRQEVVDLVQRFAQSRPEDLGQFHPSLGRMTARDWDVLMYRHLDHHLRQFGV